MDKIQPSSTVIKFLSKLSFLGQQLVVSSCINVITFSFLPDCNKMEGSTGFLHDKCMFFYHYFLVIWWLNFIMCSLSLTLSFDHRHSVIRSLVVFILTVWEFTFINLPPSGDTLMPMFFIFFRSVVFGLLVWDIVIDVDFRNCVVLIYEHFLQEIFQPFFDFLEDYIDAVDELPWVLNVMDGLDDISKFALCTNV